MRSSLGSSVRSFLATMYQDGLERQAADEITPLSDAIDVGLCVDTIAVFSASVKSWAKYRRMPVGDKVAKPN